MPTPIRPAPCHPAAVPAELTSPAPASLDDVVAAISVLGDPALPGAPWTVAQIAAALPLLAEGPSSLATEAWGARHLAAIWDAEGSTNAVRA